MKIDLFSKKIKNFFDSPSYYNKVFKQPVNPDQFTKARKFEFDKLLKFIGPYKRLHFVELGAGYGKYALPLLYLGAKITAVDIAKKSLTACFQQAKKNNIEKNLKIIINDFRFPVYSNKYDGTYCISTFHLLAEKEKERINILSNLVKSVKPGGVVVLIEPNPLNPFLYILYCLTSQASWDIEKYFLKSTEWNLKKIFQECSLKNISIDYVGFLPLRYIWFPGVLLINSIINNTPFLNKFSSFVYIKGYK